MAKKKEVKKNIIEATKEVAVKMQSIAGKDFKMYENNEDISCHIITASGTSKLGPITALYISCNTCPVSSCGCKDICYARYGNCRIWFLKVSARYTGISIWQLKEWLKNYAHTDMIRYAESGDMCKTGTNDINEKLLNYLIDCFKQLHAYTYTHAEKTEKNLKLMKKATEEGFVVSSSCETLEDVKKVMKAGVNAVLTVSTMEEKVKTVDGVKIVRCPNAGDKNIKCCNCKLCLMKKRDFAIAFPVHGCKASKAIKSGKLLNI
jgi:hypothetical protein